MEKYIDIIISSYSGYFSYLKNEIIHPHLNNYFYWLIVISLVVFILEIIFPWRKNQAIFRKDFFLDTFYLFFNYFLFNLLAFIALSNLVETFLLDFLQIFGLSIDSLQLFNLKNLPNPLALILFFIILDFVQWLTHRMLHRFEFLWQFHKVHHSVKEMGFAAHMRFHWVETIIYKSALYFPIAILGGFTLENVILIHLITLAIGHFNHANIKVDYGFLKYIFNNPKMHIWHHAKVLPTKYGVNYGISLSVWDYIFKTNYIPSDGKDIELGFNGDEKFPKNFIQQEIYPLNKE